MAPSRLTSPPHRRRGSGPGRACQALGAKPDATYRHGRSRRPARRVRPTRPPFVALAPDFAACPAWPAPDDIRGVIATAQAPDTGRGYDFVSRFFAPAQGIAEDPVTGSAHTALAPYWSGRLGRDRLTGLQASARTGLVRTAVHGDRVHLIGHAVTVLDGTLQGAAALNAAIGA